MFTYYFKQLYWKFLKRRRSAKAAPAALPPVQTLETFLSEQVLLSKRANQTLRQLFGPHVYALIADTRSGLFAVDPEDFGVSRELLQSGEYSQSEIQRLSAHIDANSSVLVVGAHVGAIAIPLSRLSKQMVAIEANPRTFRLLTINLVLNHITNCRALNVAANNRREPLKFVLNKVNSGGSKREPRVEHYFYYYDEPETISVEGVRLDTFLSHKSYDLIVMDIEGSEFFALQGMQEILTQSKSLAIEFLPHALRYVSQATLSQFLELIEPYFDNLYIPSKILSVERPHFKTVLQEMYDKDEEDSGLIFSKAVR